MLILIPVILIPAVISISVIDLAGFVKQLSISVCGKPVDAFELAVEVREVVKTAIDHH